MLFAFNVLGYEGENCEDIDECLQASLDGTSLCGSNQCTNRDGSYTCSCDVGYTNIATGGEICIGNGANSHSTI